MTEAEARAQGFTEEVAAPKRMTEAEARAAGFTEDASPAPFPEPKAEPSQAAKILDWLGSKNNPGNVGAQLASIPDVIREHASHWNDAPGGANDVPKWLVTPDEAQTARSALSGYSANAAQRIEGAAEGDQAGVAKRYQQARSEHPGAYLAGAVAPGLVSKLAGMGGALGRIAYGAGTSGAATGFGAAPGQVSASDVGESALTGAAFSGVGELIPKLGPILRGTAGRQATKAVVGTPEIGNKLASVGLDTKQSIEDFGNKALDTGIVRFGSSPGGIQERNMELLRKTGSQIGEADQAAAAATQMDRGAIARAAEKARDFQMDPTKAAALGLSNRAISQIEGDTPEAILRGLVKRNPMVEGLPPPLQQQLVGQVQPRPPPGAEDFEAMRRQLSRIHKSIPRNSTTLATDVLKDTVERGASPELNRQVAGALSPEDASKFQDALSGYSFGKTAEELGSRAVSREAGHQLPIGSAIAGTLLAGPEGGASVLAHSILRSRYSSSLAAGARAMSNAVVVPGKMMAPAGRSFTEWLQEKRDEAKESLK